MFSVLSIKEKNIRASGMELYVKLGQNNGAVEIRWDTEHKAENRDCLG